MNLKLKEKKLLRLLTHNLRFQNKDLAKSLNVSEDTVKYMKKNLKKKEVYYETILFDHRKLGYIQHHLFFNIKEPQDIDFQGLLEIENISFVNTLDGKFDLRVTFLASTESQIKTIKNKIKKILNNNYHFYSYFNYREDVFLNYALPDYNVDVEIPRNQKNIFNSLDCFKIDIPKEVQQISLDLKDKKIIKYLLEKPTASILDISQNTKVSRDTIKRRIKKYIDDKFLLAVTIAPNYKFFNYTSYILLTKIKNINTQSIRDATKNSIYIDYIEHIDGDFNLLCVLGANSTKIFSDNFKENKSFFAGSLEDMDLLFYDESKYHVDLPYSLLK